jgi:hypothetical protein
VLPGFAVDAAVEVPYGAHPTSFFPAYGYDTAFHLEWVQVARDDEAAEAFLDRYVRGPATQPDYLAAVGGASRLVQLTRR